MAETIRFEEVTNGPAQITRWRGMIMVMATFLAFVAATAVGVWGVAHAIPTGQVLAGFAPVSRDNRRILLQEWLAEAFTMWGVAATVIVATVVGGAGGHVTVWVYRAIAALLVGLAVLTGLTGARTPVVWFKLCPVLLSGSAVLLLVASVL